MKTEEIFREIAAESADFPEIFAKLDHDPKPPERIFARSGLADADFRGVFSRPSVAIVGSRKPTDYGRKITLELAQNLAKNGVVVISGLALGHDALAHRGCLDGGGKTIAVLGTPIDRLYPAQNFALAKEILAKKGVILSEIAAGEEFFAKISFLQRNRIISALADVVIVVEANLRSGSLNTAAHAKKQGKIVMAVPGNLISPLSDGTNKLIADGAKICLGAESVLAELREIYPEKFAKIEKPRKNSRKKSNKNSAKFAKTGDEISDKILAGISEKSLTTDEILREIPRAGGKLTLLELGGKIAKIGGEWVIK